MAEGKNSFVLYKDIIKVVSKLPRDKAGDLFMHILEYVNDMNPETDDIIIDIAFEPIKQSLKRDLKKWENYIEKQKVNGAKGGRPKKKEEPKKPKPFSENPTEPKKADSVSVSVSVSDSVSVKEEIPPLPPKGENVSEDLSWKDDFEVYKKELRIAFKEIQKDTDWINKQESFNQNVDIIKSIEKACVNYWATVEGWKKKKRARTKNIDWKQTFGNAISLKQNKVYKQTDDARRQSESQIPAV
nr:DUF6291 domain-containing protein [uncultured Draconibacterium sp.]